MVILDRARMIEAKRGFVVLRIRDNLVDVGWLRPVLDGKDRQVLEQAGRGVPLRLVGLDAFDDLRQRVQGVGALPRRRRMSAGAPHVDLQLQAALLSHAQQVGKVSRRLDGIPATLVHRQRGRQLFGVVVGHPAEPIAAAVFLVGAGGQDQAVPERHVVPLENPHGDELAG